MKLSIETRYGPGEKRGYQSERRYDVDLPWDAGAREYIDAMAAFMFAATFDAGTITDAFHDYAEEHEEGETWTDDSWDDFDEETEADADEKTAPDDTRQSF